MKRIYIIHGWSGSSTSDWMPWLRDALEKEGLSVSVPDMPDPDNPKMERWVDFLTALAANADTDTYFVGHSMGCQAIVRYLSALPENVRIGGAIFVAPVHKTIKNMSESESDIAGPWLNTPILWDKIRLHSNSFVVVYSDNDPYIPSEDAELFGKNLGARLVLDPNRGHFSDDDDVTQLPVVLEELVKLVSMG